MIQQVVRQSLKPTDTFKRSFESLMHFSLDAELMNCKRTLDKIELNKKYALKNAPGSNLKI